MKYQFQFAGANVAAPKPQRRRLRMGLLVAGVVLAALAYGFYLFNLTHHRTAPENRAAAASAVAVVAKPTVTATAATATAAAVTATAAATEPATVTAPATATAANNSELNIKVAHPAAAASSGVFTHLLEVLQIAKAAPAVAEHPQIISITAPATQPQTVAVAPTSVPKSVNAAPVVAKPVPHWRPLTAEQRLARAGELAMENMLIKATKYPGAYGFRAEDTFEQAKLGQAIPIYTITDADRASYQPGQRIKPLLKATGQWMFPVLSGDHVCCMVSVKSEGHEYVPGDSSKALGEAWSVISEKWPAEAGFHPQLVVYSGMPGYYFTVPELPVPNVTDTIKMTMYQPDVSPADVILASWR
jgi:hypothetical protein